MKLLFFLLFTISLYANNFKILKNDTGFIDTEKVSSVETIFQGFFEDYSHPEIINNIRGDTFSYFSFSKGGYFINKLYDHIDHVKEPQRYIILEKYNFKDGSFELRNFLFISDTTFNESEIISKIKEIK